MLNLLIVDLENVMQKDRGSKVRSRKIYTLVYVDDVVLLAEKKKGMKCMIQRLERYLEEKGLVLNAKK